MDEKKGPGEKPEERPPETCPKERVGEILRKERERRDVSIFVIAKDLRLNPKFIEALEANDYDLLPGDTYIRVYLRSLCKYFSLNADELLERFFKERGLCGVDTLRKDSRTKINLAALREKEKPNKTAILAASVFIVLALLSFVATQQGWFSTETRTPVTAKLDSTSLQNHHKDSAAGMSQKVPDTLAADSLSNDGPDLDNTAAPVKARDSVPKTKTRREIRDSIHNAKARSKFIKDSILRADAKSKLVKDSILRADEKSKLVKDSILRADEKSKLVKDSILRADAKSKLIKDSILRADAKSKLIKDSILKADAKSKLIKDSILRADAKSKPVNDSTLKPVEKSKFIKDSISKAETRNKILVDEILKAQAKAKVIKDSVSKAEAKSKAVKDSILKTEAKNKAVKDSTLKAESSAAKTPPENSQTMELKLVVTGQSAWARILDDGVPWRNIIRKGSVRTFSAKDSFNLRTGQLEDIVLTLNGKKLDVPAKGTIALKIDHSGITVLTDEQWFKLTKGRF